MKEENREAHNKEVSLNLESDKVRFIKLTVNLARFFGILLIAASVYFAVFYALIEGVIPAAVGTLFLLAASKLSQYKENVGGAKMANIGILIISILMFINSLFAYVLAFMAGIAGIIITTVLVILIGLLVFYSYRSMKILKKLDD